MNSIDFKLQISLKVFTCTASKSIDNKFIESAPFASSVFEKSNSSLGITQLTIQLSKERKRAIEKARERVCVCVCVCVYERERERER